MSRVRRMRTRTMSMITVEPAKLLPIVPAAPRRLLGMNRAELEAFVQELGEPAYRGRQLAQWLYRRGARHFDEMTDLPAPRRARLGDIATVGRSDPVTAPPSRDGTQKL